MGEVFRPPKPLTIDENRTSFVNHLIYLWKHQEDRKVMELLKQLCF
jgi:hypothetical protein